MAWTGTNAPQRATCHTGGALVPVHATNRDRFSEMNRDRPPNGTNRDQCLSLVPIDKPNRDRCDFGARPKTHFLLVAVTQAYRLDPHADGPTAPTVTHSRRASLLRRRPNLRRRQFTKSRRDRCRRLDADGCHRHRCTPTAKGATPMAWSRWLLLVLL
jgi:hypothetical protein